MSNGRNRPKRQVKGKGSGAGKGRGATPRAGGTAAGRGKGGPAAGKGGDAAEDVTPRAPEAEDVTATDPSGAAIDDAATDGDAAVGDATAGDVPTGDAPEGAAANGSSTTGDAAGDTAAAGAAEGTPGSSGKASRSRRASSGPGGDAPRRSLRARLYHGETNFDFIGRRRIWFGISIALVLLGVVGLFTRGLNLGIDFEGGVVWEVPAGEASVADARDAVDDFGLAGATIQELESDEGREVRVEAEPISPEESDEVTAALAELTGASVDDVDLTSVGPSWGEEISEKAARALVVFLVLVTLYIAVRFELKMAIPTLVALVHDVLIVVGFYAWTQLEVTPATVIAVLTILGYSIYDGIVVFDKVDENTRRVSSTGGLSYSGMVNLSLNQALMRSLNTSITALLPVASLLVVGSWVMGAATLEEFAIALLIGLASGAYSSPFIASPLLAVLKEREPRYREIAKRVAARGGDREVVAAIVAGGRPGKVTPTASAAGGAATDAKGDPVPAGATVSPSGRAIPPRPRKKAGKGQGQRR